MKTILIINGKQADTNENTVVLFTYSQGDLTDPAVVKNTFSQSVKLPITKTNDAIFNSFRRSDYGGTFNPLKRVDFELRNEMQEVIESGYCKLDELNPGAAGYYAVTLYGGLGSFLWAMKYDEEGNPLTLADLTYSWSGGTYKGPGLTATAAVVSAAWNAILNNTSGVYKVLNFAPALNGIPKDFDANKAIFIGSNPQQAGLKDYENLGGAPSGYFPVGTTTGVLMTMASEHDEWEMNDLRASLQRPVISMIRFLLALENSANTHGYRVTMSNELYGSGIVKALWMVLPFPEDGKGSLELTATPTDYLLSLVKMLGMHIVCNRKNVTITTDTEFYTQTRDDWSGRVSLDGRTIQPVVAEHRFLDFSIDAVGSFATDYESKYNRKYGSQRVDTGYDFDKDTTDLLKDLPIKGAADVLPSSPAYSFRGLNNCTVAAIEPCTYKVSDGTNYEDYTTDYQNPRAAIQWASGMSLFSALPQLNDGSPVDAAGLFLLYEGAQALPMQSVSGASNFWHLSDTTQEMLDLNDGKPCWDIRYRKYGSSPAYQLTRIPLFRRSWPYICKTLELGQPSSVATSDNWAQLDTIYEDWWSNYIAERYGKGARVLTAKVNLTGLQVGYELLRKFYYFDGANWLLTKIKDYDFTTPRLTTCEFVKVTDMSAYRIQNVSAYLAVSARPVTLSPIQSQEHPDSVKITASVAWTIAITAVNTSKTITLSQSSGGSAGWRTEITVTMQTSNNTGTTSREWLMTLTSSDGRIVKKIKIIQPGGTI